MAGDPYVLDASVAAKWYLPSEDDAEAALDWLRRCLADEIELHAPIILMYELAHVLTKAQRLTRGHITEEDTADAYATFCELPITFHTLDDAALLEALRLANRLQRGFYDCSYVVLAMRLKCRWPTSERRYGGFPSDVITDHVAPLSAPSEDD